MRRGPVILTSAAIALIAVVLGLLAWRADATSGADAVDSQATPLTAASTTFTTTAAAARAGTSTTPPQPIPTTAPTPLPSTDPPATSAAPPSTVAATAAPIDGPSSSCPSTDHGAVVDRGTQRAWLCGDGAIVAAMPITSAWSMPDPGTYPVYAKDLAATSTFGGHFSRMTHFVAFTHGERTGARIAFHSVPTLNDGTFVQTLDSVGDLDLRGESSGCIRVLPDDAARIWEWLSVGDEVHVVS